MHAAVRVFVVSVAFVASASSQAQARHPGEPNTRQLDFAFGWLYKNNDGALSRRATAADKRISGLVDDAARVRKAGAVVAKVGGVKSMKNSLLVK